MKNHPRPWLAALPAMTIPFVGALFYFVILRDSQAAKLAYVLTKVFVIVWPVVCIKILCHSDLPSVNLRAERHRRAIPLGIAIGCLFGAVMIGATFTPIGRVVSDGASRIRETQEQLGILSYYWLFAFFVAVVNSLIEEYYWRWFIYGTLREVTGVTLAVILSGASFAAHHVIITCQYFPLGWALFFGVCVGVGGAAWSLMYEKQRTIVGTWVSHIIADLAIMWIAYRLLFA